MKGMFREKSSVNCLMKKNTRSMYLFFALVFCLSGIQAQATSPVIAIQQKATAINDDIEVGFGDSMRELHSNVISAIDVIQLRSTSLRDKRVDDAVTLRRLEEVRQLFDTYLRTVGPFSDEWKKFASHIEGYYARQNKIKDQRFLVQSGGQALAIAASADPVNGVLDPIGMSSKSKK
jgi:hypothetical protein